MEIIGLMCSPLTSANQGCIIPAVRYWQGYFSPVVNVRYNPKCSPLAISQAQGGTKSGVNANAEVQITPPITFSDYGYTALAIPSGSTPVYVSKDALSRFRILKTANVGSYIYWLAVGY